MLHVERLGKARFRNSEHLGMHQNSSQQDRHHLRGLVRNVPARMHNTAHPEKRWTTLHLQAHACPHLPAIHGHRSGPGAGPPLSSREIYRLHPSKSRVSKRSKTGISWRIPHFITLGTGDTSRFYRKIDSDPERKLVPGDTLRHEDVNIVSVEAARWDLPENQFA